MGTIVCQDCSKTVDHFHDEKVTVLYSKCDGCEKKKRATLEKK
ncbi:GapA-binding peptide SR1P [Alkalihalobacillus sp. MEB130]|nr:GapA-binding peptide SR1P [Alkalihalobacillus sp. MEB130]MDT8862101.1 GapA-binding peptide SR1P [Alkalihalobacillus sp. MEB130]